VWATSLMRRPSRFGSGRAGRSGHRPEGDRTVAEHDGARLAIARDGERDGLAIQLERAGSGDPLGLEAQRLKGASGEDEGGADGGVECESSHDVVQRDRPEAPALGEVDDGHYTTPLGAATVRRSGNDVTVLAYGTMVYVAEAACEETGVDGEVIDLRTLVPLDLDTITASVRKTGRCVVVHEATLTSGFGAELAALVQHDCFYSLEAPVARVAGWDTPYPHAQEWDYFPGPERVGRALVETMGG